ncbi:MAG: hypothetical protein ACTHQE_18190 [Thermomicrobiales bacterium]
MRRWTEMLAGLVMACMVVVSPGSVVAGPATLPATGTPAADAGGCDALPAYFAQANALTSRNDGLAILRAANFDVLSLTVEQASSVVASLDGLLAAWDTLAPPPAAQAWHDATRDLYAWYRDLAANRDHLDHQRLINGDKTIVPALGRATLAGQQTCGYQRWNDAVSTAPASTATPAATPAAHRAG